MSVDGQAAGDTSARVDALLDVGRTGPAVELLSRAVATAPDDPDLWCQLARALLQSGLGEEFSRGALTASRRAIALDPTQEWPYRLASVAHSRLGDMPAAIEAARAAVRVEPLVWRAHDRLAEVLVDEPRHVDEAWRAARRALELAPPDESDPHLTVGWLAMRAKDWQRAEEAFRRVLALDPDNAEALKQLGVIQGERNEPAQQLGTFQAAIRAAPRHHEVRHRLDEALALQLVTMIALCGVALGLLLLVAPRGPTLWHPVLTVLGVVATVLGVRVTFRDDLAPAGQYLRRRLRRAPAQALALVCQALALATALVGGLVALVVPSGSGTLRVALLMSLLAFLLAWAGIGRSSMLADRAEATDMGLAEPGADDDVPGTLIAAWREIASLAGGQAFALGILIVLAGSDGRWWYQATAVVLAALVGMGHGVLINDAAGLIAAYGRRVGRLNLPLTLAAVATVVAGVTGLGAAAGSLLWPVPRWILVTALVVSVCVLVPGAAVVAALSVRGQRDPA